MTAPKILMDGIILGESPRWQAGHLWFADWGPGEIIRIGAKGEREVMARAPAPPLSFDFLPGGALLVGEAQAKRLSRRTPDGSLEPYADLSGLADGLWNEIVVDGRGNAYVNGGCLALVTPDGKARHVAESGKFPNGMAVTPDNRTLILAESMGQCLTAFDIAADGSLTNRRLWADINGHYPDGICIDAEGCVWVADVPHRCCMRVSQGGEILQKIEMDLGAFSCTLGGPNRSTLFITTGRWLGMDRMAEMPPDGQVLAFEVEVPGAGWP